MIKRECETVWTLTKCQIPYNEQGLSGIVDLVALIAIVWFSIYAVKSLLGRLVR